jgi:hypothetical protein
MSRRNAAIDRPANSENDKDRPNVILEFLFDRGLIHICVNNIGNRPAIGISVTFNKKIVGLGGKKEISALSLFDNIEFLGPGREIVAFVDTSHSYFARKQPTRISARVSYSDSSKQKYEVTINHDLEIYRELTYLTAGANQMDCVDKTGR